MCKEDILQILGTIAQIDGGILAIALTLLALIPTALQLIETSQQKGKISLAKKEGSNIDRYNLLTRDYNGLTLAARLLGLTIALCFVGMIYKQEILVWITVASSIISLIMIFSLTRKMFLKILSTNDETDKSGS